MQYFLNIFTFKNSFFETTPVTTREEAYIELQEIKTQHYTTTITYKHTLWVTDEKAEIITL